ncbi:Os03g0190500 [Oryza sativa Japonica Group]|uniref:Os03g0190500 protein n=1 Tax=Oryza sativa subsp. japonica TaxID=39947 RepID=A0A0N7KGR0_ORYSJ|nr:hypothetical protein EE612_015792 [Oryza sativa]BAS82713.1 Os03g0190500 [Oryza sativa Japonica Group]
MLSILSPPRCNENGIQEQMQLCKVAVQACTVLQIHDIVKTGAGTRVHLLDLCISNDIIQCSRQTRRRSLNSLGEYLTV